MANTPQYGGFNPGVPNVNPQEYLNYSRPISDIPADKSAGQLLAQLGDMAQMGFKVGDKLIKDKIQADIYDKVDVERNNFSSALDAERTRMLNAGGSLAQPQVDNGVDTYPENANPVEQQTGPLSLTPQNIPPNPGIKAGIDAASTIENARRNNQGNLSMTYYDAKLESIQKEMRAKWPMYREYIDQQMSAITGSNPANAVIRSRMSDINRLIQNSGNFDQKITNQVLSQAKNYDGGDEIVAGLANKTVSPMAAYSWLNQREAAENNMKNLSTRFSLLDAGDKNYAKEAESSYVGVLDQMQQNFFNNIEVASGMTSLKNIQEWYAKVASGEIKPDARQAQIYGQQLQVYIDKFQAEARRRANTPAIPGGKTFAQALDKDKLEGRIQQYTQNMTDMQNNLIKGDFALVNANTNAIKAQNSNIAANLYDGNPNGRLQLVGALRQAFGDQFVSDLAKRELLVGLSQEATGLFNEQRIKALTQQKSMYSDRQYTTMASALRKGQQVMKENLDPNFFPKLVEIPMMIVDPKVPLGAKENAAIFAFDPENKGLITKIPETHRYNVFRDYTSKQFAANVLDATQNNTELRNQYKDWTENTASILFNNDIKTINRRINAVKNELGVDSKMIELGYDEKNGKFILRPLIDEKRNPAYREVKPLVDRLNVGLEGMKNVSQAVSPDANPNAYVYNLLRSQGFGEDTGGIIKMARDGFQKAVGAVGNIWGESVNNPNSPNYIPPTGPDASRNTLNFDQENRGPSVADFMANPIGGRIPVAPEPKVKRNLNLTGPGRTSEVVSVDEMLPDESIQDALRRTRR